MEIHSDMLKGVVKVLPKEMEDKTKPLIEQMVKQDPDERPTVLDVLTGDHIPQDKGFEQMKELLENHKNPEKLKLMRFLCQLKIPQALDLTYLIPQQSIYYNQKKIQEREAIISKEKG